MVPAGSAADVFQGGAGGNGYFEPQCGFSSGGGDGGDGLHAVNGGIRYASGTPLGGKGGAGTLPGKDGQPTEGDVTVNPSLPTCQMLGTSALGSTFTFSFGGAAKGDQLVGLFSGAVGSIAVPGTEGFPLFAVPGKFFLAIPLGTFDATGKRDVPIAVPNDPSLRGGAVFAQGVVSSPTGTHKAQLTNVSYAIVKEP